MTKKAYRRCLLAATMMLLLVFTHPTGASLSNPDPACMGQCFEEYNYCMNHGPDKAECYAIWDACYRSCPEVTSR